MCTPSQPSAGGRSGPAILGRKAIGRPRRARPVLARRGRTARRPSGRLKGPPPPRSGARCPSGTDCWLGATPPRQGGWGCPAPSSPAPIEVCRDGGSLPATSKERGSAPALRWPWPNCNSASDLDDRGRVRPSSDFVSGDPQSEPDTQDQPPPPSPGSHYGPRDSASRFALPSSPRFAAFCQSAWKMSRFCGCPAEGTERGSVGAGSRHRQVLKPLGRPSFRPGWGGDSTPAGGADGVRPGGRGDRRRSGGNADHAARRSLRGLSAKPSGVDRR